VAHINATPYGGGRYPALHQAGVAWGMSGVRQRNWGTPAAHPAKPQHPRRNLASGGVWSATLGVPGQTHPDLARSRRCTTSGRDTLFGNVHPTNRDRA